MPSSISRGRQKGKEKMKEKKQQSNHVPVKPKIYPLPCLFTTASLFSGFYAIISAFNGDFFSSAVAIIIAGIFDGLDGRVARLTNTTSKFGMEYDSLCDLVSFGVAPALLAYMWALEPYGRYGWLAAFLYVATTALRLARFNAMADEYSPKDFIGLPCPAAAAMIATTVLFSHFMGATGTVKHLVILLLVYVLSYLMVSNFRYLSFKHPETTRAKKFHVLVGMVLLLIVIATEPSVTLFMVGLAYVLSGPLGAGYRLLSRDKKTAEEQEHSI